MLLNQLPGIVKTIGFSIPELFIENDSDLNPIFRDSSHYISEFTIVTKYMTNGCIEPYVKDYLDSEGTNNAKMNPTIRSKIIFGVAAIMKQVHENNYISNGLNISSIFFDDYLEPKISPECFYVEMFFNSHNILNPLNCHGLSMYYYSPEMLEDEQMYDNSTDVYAFGFLIYRMFSNKIEFDYKMQPRSPMNYFHLILKGLRPVRPKFIPDPYWKLINECWDHSPMIRPSFAEIVKKLKKDKYAIEEFGMKTDLDELHEYQSRMDVDVVIKH